MNPEAIRDKTAVVGVGCCQFGENWTSSREDMIVDAVYEAYEDAGIEDPDRQIDAVFAGAVYPREGSGEDGALAGDGVFLLGREWAGGERGSAAIGDAEPFDLVVIDEAHEIFAGIHRRYDRRGNYKAQADVAVLAHRVREATAGCPKLLLTATPIQNSLRQHMMLQRRFPHRTSKVTPKGAELTPHD